MHKKLLIGSVSLMLVLGIGFMGFGDALDAVLERGKLIIGTHAMSKPWQYRDPESGEYTGFVIDLVKMFCEELDVGLEVIDLEWAALLPGLLAGKFDMWAADISRTVPRAAKILYTEPIVFDPGVAVAKKGRFTSLAELNNPNVTVSSETGSIHATIAEKMFPEAKLVTFPSGAEHLMGLLTGRTDAALEGRSKVAAWVAEHEELEILPGYTMIDSFAFAVRYDSYKLKECFDLFLRIIKLDGRYSALYKKWFGIEWEPIYIEHGL